MEVPLSWTQNTSAESTVPPLSIETVFFSCCMSVEGARGGGGWPKKAALGAKSNGLLQRSTNPTLACLNTQKPGVYRGREAWGNRRHAARREKEDNRCLNGSERKPRTMTLQSTPAGPPQGPLKSIGNFKRSQSYTTLPKLLCSVSV